jgi:hypothetical protein
MSQSIWRLSRTLISLVSMAITPLGTNGMELRNSLSGEKLISLQTACDILRSRQPEDASRLHVATVYRWASKGVRGQRLETEHHGSKRFTSVEAIDRFVTRRERTRSEIETAVPPDSPLLRPDAKSSADELRNRLGKTNF